LQQLYKSLRLAQLAFPCITHPSAKLCRKSAARTEGLAKDTQPYTIHVLE
jgi:hypothetical protein